MDCAAKIIRRKEMASCGRCGRAALKQTSARTSNHIDCQLGRPDSEDARTRYHIVLPFGKGSARSSACRVSFVLIEYVRSRNTAVVGVTKMDPAIKLRLAAMNWRAIKSGCILLFLSVVLTSGHH